jgi:FMN-dependent NADH-azoreductase
MATILFVKAHPGTASTSISLKLAEKFLEAYKTANPTDTLELLDLYTDDIPLIDADVMSAWGKGGQNLTDLETQKVTRMAALQDQFIRADKVIFAAPMWNFGYPPMLKAYIDAAVVVGGKTFGYTAQGPVPLLKDQGRKAIVLEARGSHFSGTPMDAFTHSYNHLKGLLNFIGIDEVQLIPAEGVAQFPDKREEIIASALTNVSSAAQQF